MGILKLNRIRNIILCGLLTSFFFSCESKNSLNKKRQKVEEYCRNKKYINQIDINFLGYSYHEISEISVEISGTQKKKFSFTVSERIVDSIRELRTSFINQKINIKDTITLTFPNKERFILTDFRYKVRPHFTMMSKNWGCDFYAIKINNVIEEGGSATFIKKGFNIK